MGGGLLSSLSRLMLRLRGVRLVGERLRESPPVFASVALRERGRLSRNWLSFLSLSLLNGSASGGCEGCQRLTLFPPFSFASNLLFVAWLLVAFSVFGMTTVLFKSARGLATRIPVFEDCGIPRGPSAFACSMTRSVASWCSN